MLVYPTDIASRLLSYVSKYSLTLLVLVSVYSLSCTPTEPESRLVVCMEPDTVWVELRGDSAMMVFERCW